MKVSRTDRLAELLKKELAQRMNVAAQSSRAGLVSITDLTIANDLSHAKVYVSILGGKDPQAMIERLNELGKPWRQELSKSMHIRTIQLFKFVLDGTLEHADRITQLINAAVAADKQHNTES